MMWYCSSEGLKGRCGSESMLYGGDYVVLQACGMEGMMWHYWGVVWRS
jgi:hypothetical protein